MTVTTLIIKIKCKFKFNDINDLINNIKNNTISEANAKKKINELNKIKKVETKGKRLINSQKILLSLPDYIKTIFNNNNNYNRLVGLFGHEFIIAFLLFYVSKKLYM